jgi:hypothetical protein
MTMSRRWVGLLLGLMVAQVARAAEASDGGTSSAPGVVAAPDAGASAADLLTSDGGSSGSLATEAADAGLVPAESTAGAPRRERADFRGQQDPPPTTGDVLIWIPRVILLPAYLVTEYVVRVPVGALATTAEKNHWPTAVFDVFVFGPDHRGGIIPTFFVDFGVRPSIGLHFFWDDTFVRDNRFTADVAWGGSNWVTVAMGDRYSFNQADSLAIAARWNRRPDNLYYGIGPEVDVSTEARTRYGSDLVSGGMEFEHKGILQIKAAARIDRTVFRDYSCCSDPTLNERVAAGQLPAPPGFQENTTAASIPLRVVIDTRPSGPWHRSGVRAGAEVAPAVDVTRGFDRSWLRYAATLQGFWDMTGTGRVLGLGAWAAFVDELGGQPVPFTNLVTLGGTEPFTGFIVGSLRDQSAVAMELSYHWPVFAHLDGVAAVSFGNVFPKHLRNFDVDLLRMSAELGIRTRDTGNNSFQLIVGTGSNTFREGFTLKTFRFAFGVTYGL